LASARVADTTVPRGDAAIGACRCPRRRQEEAGCLQNKKEDVATHDDAADDDGQWNKTKQKQKKHEGKKGGKYVFRKLRCAQVASSLNKTSRIVSLCALYFANKEGVA
jgi:hypothetical protein